MAARDYQLALGAVAVRLSDVFGDGAGVINAANDLPFRQLLLTATGATAFLGGAADVTSTKYGAAVPTTAAQPVSIGPFESGPIKLSTLYVAGAGSTLHVLGIPF